MLTTFLLLGLALPTHVTVQHQRVAIEYKSDSETTKLCGMEANGCFKPAENLIIVNSDMGEKVMRSNLLHEVKHAVVYYRFKKMGILDPLALFELYHAIDNDESFEPYGLWDTLQRNPKVYRFVTDQPCWNRHWWNVLPEGCSMEAGK